MYTGLKDKLLEFRNLAPESSLSEILEDEKRLDFEKSMRSNDLQMYRNRQQQHGFGKYGAIRLGELKRNECLFLSDLKHNESKNILAEERKNSEERLARALKESSEKADNTSKKRMLLRNSEPELRELAAKIRQRLNGQCIISQMEYKRKQHLDELAMEVELEKEVVEADRLAEENKLEEKRKTDREKRDEMMRSMAEQRAQRISKHQAERAEKEDSHRIIRELVQEENEKIAAELIAKRSSREALASDYEKFIAYHEDKKARLLQEQLAQEEKLRQEQQAINERRDQVEQKKKANVNARIQIQEAVGKYTNALQATYEKQRLAFLEANEIIANSKSSLAEYNMKQDQELSRKQIFEQRRQEWENLLEYRRRIKKEEQELEKKLDQMNMEVMNREAEEHKAKKLVDQTRKKEEMLNQIEKRRQQQINEALDKKQEEAAYLNRQEEYQQLVDAERKAMLAEYAEYLNTLVECGQRSNA